MQILYTRCQLSVERTTGRLGLKKQEQKKQLRVANRVVSEKPDNWFSGDGTS